MIDEENQGNPGVGATAVSSAGDEVKEEVEVLEQVPVDEQSPLDVETATAESTTLGDVVLDLDDTEMAEVPSDYASALAQRDSEIQALKLQLEDRNGQFARMAADFDNFRKRIQREREEQEQKIKCDTILELLPVVDNFERARSQIQPKTDGENTIHKSYQSVYRQLVECLKKVGVAPMRAEGKEFDPTMHEAVMREPTDKFPEGTVIEELQRGYLLGDRILRHALVKVAAAPDPVITSEESQVVDSEG